MATREQLRRFLGRPWEQLRASKDRHVSEIVAREGSDAAFRIADGLSRRAEEADAHPTEAAREDDLATAVRIRRLLDRAGRRHQRAR